MSGDKLAIFLSFAGTAVAAVMGAVATNGWRARTLWAAALFFGLASLIYLEAQRGAPAMGAILVLWGFSPLIAMSMFWIVMSGRTEKKLPPKPRIPLEPAQINPALTAAHFSDIVRSGTKLEAQRRLAAYSHQLAKLSGEVVDIHSAVYSIRVSVRGLAAPSDHRTEYGLPMSFRRDQADALAVIKPGDWIEFVGKVQHCNTYGWELVDCEFVGRASPPPKPRPRRKTDAARS